MEESIYAQLFRELAARNVRYVLCGGLALVFQHIKRFTADADIAVEFTTENVKRFVDAITAIGYGPRVPVDPHDLAHATKREEWKREKDALVFTFVHPRYPFQPVDVFLESPLPFDELLSSARRISMGESAIIVASYESILKMKRKIVPPREKDALDILLLERIVNERKDI